MTASADAGVESIGTFCTARANAGRLREHERRLREQREEGELMRGKDDDDDDEKTKKRQKNLF